MKNFLFILTLLFSMLFVCSLKDEQTNNMGDLIAQQETIMKEKNVTDMQHHLEILGSDLQDSKGLNARRTIQTASNTINIRLLKIEEKALQDLRLKEMNVLRKVSEEVTICETINHSTLLCRMGYHVYGLRKIII